jgi:putative ABC transport system substrate-binding protein
VHSEIREVVAKQVTQILGGIRPADIPFVQPSKFELVINQGTARGLGLSIPKSLAVAADDVLN